jgi:succinate dehydrogenase/fumarate reductase flavoprotein subunit
LLLAESEDSLDGWLLNRQGERFMQRWDPERLERTTRDKLTAAIATEVSEGRGSPGGGVYLSLAHLPVNLIDHFADWALKPRLKKNWKYGEMNFQFIRDQLARGEALEVGPACHFFVGGAHVDLDCRSTVSGLCAAGEVVGGLHGANRLSGNACMEMLVEGEIAGRQAARIAQQSEIMTFSADLIDEHIQAALAPVQRPRGISPYRIKNQIRRWAWQNVGTLRNEVQLQKTLRALAQLREDQARAACGSHERVYNREWICALENRNSIDLLEVTARSALIREESRGVHVRSDWPHQSENWRCNLIARAIGGEIQVEKRSVVQ